MVSDKSAARLEFARRLRELRVPMGFRTARSLAKALDIDENRYTRYERAEVEPDLSLIRRMCEILRITPNDLLGTGDVPVPFPGLHNLADNEPGAEPREIDATASSAESHAPAASLIQTIGWNLACAVAELRLAASRTPPQAPLVIYQQAAPVFEELSRRPFEFISRMVMEDAVAHAPPQAAERVHRLVEELTSALKRTVP